MGKEAAPLPKVATPHLISPTAQSHAVRAMASAALGQFRARTYPHGNMASLSHSARAHSRAVVGEPHADEHFARAQVAANGGRALPASRGSRARWHLWRLRFCHA